MPGLALLERASRRIEGHLEARATKARLATAAAKPEDAPVSDEVREDREACKSLAVYMRRAWHALEPNQALIWERVLDEICHHLEAVSNGQIKRLMIGVPPGFSKSVSTCVYWPSWEWGPHGKPWLKHLSFSYSIKLSRRDNRRCRQLMNSNWYQERWGNRFGFARDQNQAANFENSATGWRQASSVTGTATGLRADRIILDDLLNARDQKSLLKLDDVALFLDETLPTRLVDQRSSAIVLIMQRLHPKDPIGHLLAKDLGYEYLRLPMRYEAKARCVTSIGGDWRTREGDLLSPRRYPEDAVALLEKSLGSYGTAGQLQQRPTPRGGGMLQVEKIKIVQGWPAEAKVCRSWDFAASHQLSRPDPDWTRGAKCAFHAGIFYVLDMRSLRGTAAVVEGLVKQTAQLDGYACKVRIPQDPGSAGKALADHYVLNVLPGWAVRVDRETGPKEIRAEALATAIENGNVRLLQGPWNDALIGEMRDFPFGAHDDQVDAVVAAYVMLTQGAAEPPPPAAPLIAKDERAPPTF